MNIKKIRLQANYILTTKNEYDGKTAEDGVIIPAGTLKEYQTVVAVGPMVRNIKEGDIVWVNPKRYAVTKYAPSSLKADIEQMQKVVKYNFNVIEIDHKKHLLLVDQDIDFVVEEYEESPNIIVPETKIIT